ncbi:MAG: hypothetical protein COX07_00220 [Bacteroidetes bacterium CG23_combo_of_CG06-09_8_20_14_all_32_9]|nr:MAG: hypothetical protein COX07_00220 [Bacteroidetes bacterium CG23_combo_of_CG06-09_8_20_14_all_32_9]
MEIKKFKTNLHCSGCTARLNDVFKTEPRIKSWEVDLNHKNKILTVSYEGISETEIIQIIRKAGYAASVAG